MAAHPLTPRGRGSSQTGQLGRALGWWDMGPMNQLNCPSVSRVSKDPASVSKRAFHPCCGSPGAGHGPASLTWWVCRTVRMMKSLAFL